MQTVITIAVIVFLCGAIEWQTDVDPTAVHFAIAR